MTYFLGIDIGGTVIKSGLYDGEGREKAVASEVDNGVAVRVGWSERNMHDMWRIVVKTIRRVVAESGVLAKEDVQLLLGNHVNAFLVGEAFMRAPSPGAALAGLFAPSTGC